MHSVRAGRNRKHPDRAAAQAGWIAWTFAKQRALALPWRTPESNSNNTNIRMPACSVVSPRKRAASDPAPTFAPYEAPSSHAKPSLARRARSRSAAHATPTHLRLPETALPILQRQAGAKEEEDRACALSCLRFVMSSQKQSCHDLEHPRVAQVVESGCGDICSKFLESHRVADNSGGSTICNDRMLPRKLTERVGSNTGRIITLALGNGGARSVSRVRGRD